MPLMIPSPAATAPPTCVDHLDQQVTGTCTRCGRFTCEACSTAERAARTGSTWCWTCTTMAPPPPRGIGGWLLVFGVLVTLSDLLSLWRIVQAVDLIRTGALFEQPPAAMIICTGSIAMGVALFLVTSYALLLFFRRSVGAPAWLKAHLALAVFVAFLEFLPLISEGGQLVAPLAVAVIFSVFKSVGGALYLGRSTRVKHTFVR